MVQNDLTFNVHNDNTTKLYDVDSYDTIFNYNNCIEPPYVSYSFSSTEDDDLDNNAIESILKTEHDDGDIKPNKNTSIGTRKSQRNHKKKGSSLSNLLRTKRGLLSMTKFKKIQNKMIVTAKNGVISFTIIS